MDNERADPTLRAAVERVRDWMVKERKGYPARSSTCEYLGSLIDRLTAALDAAPPEPRTCAVCGKDVDKPRYVCYPCIQFAAAMGGELAYANEQMGSMEVALRLHRDDRKAIKAILDSQEGPTEAATGQGCSEKIECPKCKGTGSVLVRYHWSGIALCIECDKCKGTGKIKKPKKEAPHDT